MKLIFSIFVYFSLSLSIISISKGQASSSANATSLQADSTLQIKLNSLQNAYKFSINTQQLDSAYFKTIETFNFKDASIKDLFRAIAREYNLNLIVQESVRGTTTIRLSSITVIEAIFQICIEANLKPELRGNVLTIQIVEKEIKTREQVVALKDGKITIDIDKMPIDLFMRRIIEQSDIQFVKQLGLEINLTGFIMNTDLLKALRLVAETNGLALRKKDDIIYLERSFQSFTNSENNGQFGWVQVSKDSLITLEVNKMPILDIIYEIAKQLNLNLITYATPTGTLNAKFKDIFYLEALSLIIRSSGFTFRSENGIIIIGNKQTSGITNNKLLKLKHLRADNIINNIPDIIRKDSYIQVIKEQNALMLIGTPESIYDISRYISEMDLPTPQILMEVMVVDVNENNLFELGATIASSSSAISNESLPSIGSFGQAGASGRQTGGLNIQGTGSTINKLFGSNGNLLGIKNLGQLPSDFFVRIQALSQEGKIEIRSRPQIATLNGHEASIEIGTTQYFILTSTTPLQSANQIISQESQRFEKIEANVSLKITPYVNASGEVTTEIHPEFNTPVGEFNPDIPPTINKRVLDSTVRLKDGETIILGGLIQETISSSKNKIPFLGDIPLLGRLFTNTFKEKGRSELIIFITPHVFYGDEEDNYKWKNLKKKLTNEEN